MTMQAGLMEEMTIRLISVNEQGDEVSARLHADAPRLGVQIWLHVRFEIQAGTTRREWAAEAYDRALAVLDPA